MNFLNRIKIRTKLTILITLMLVGLLVVGITGYYNIRQTGIALTDMYEQHLVTTELLSDVRTQSRGNFANVLKLMLITDASYQKDVLADIDTRKAAISDDFANYEKTRFDEIEKEKYAALKEKQAEWDTILSQAVEQSTSGKTTEALDLFRTSGEKVFEDLQTIIRDLLNDEIGDADKAHTQTEAAEKTAEALLIIIIIATAVICITLGIFITRAITYPLSRVVSLMKKTAEFDLAYDASFESLLKYKDELGTITHSAAESRKALREMASKIIGISNNLAAHSEELTASTDENTKTINQVVTAINEIAEGNGSQAEMVNKTSSTMANIVQSIGEVNATTAESADNAIKSLDIVSEGQDAVKLNTDKMQDNIVISGKVSVSISELGEVIGKVGNITDVINSIAEQTNLLALNAAIEAARAGEAGKGFAVVADEIRKLAEGSSSAAKEIASIVKDIVEKNRIAAENMGKAREVVGEQEKAADIIKIAFGKIEASVDDIAKRIKSAAVMLSGIDTASKEISNQTQDMAAIAEQSAASSQEISASSEEQLASIEMISKAASDLSVMALELNNEVSKFKI